MTEQDALIEDLVFQCLEARDPEAAMARVAQEHPELGERVRKIYSGLVASELLAAEPASPHGSVRTEIGGFRIIRELGAGGMGLVYLAEQSDLGRQVALKVVRPEFLAVPGSRERFRREVEAVSSLQHPGVVQVFTVGEDDGWPYFAMEYVKGRNLAEIIRHFAGRDPSTLHARALADFVGIDSQNGSGSASASSGRRLFGGSWTEACTALVRQVADALEHAHDRGVLHRDVKPSNVLVTRDGRARLTDFGLARIEGGQELTRSTTQMGSLPYLPPESLGLRQPIPSPALDVYQLGVLLYELLALRHPYRAEHPEQTRRAILDGRPSSLRAQNRGVGRDLETACLVAMDPVPAQRYGTVAEFAGDLLRVAERRSVRAHRPGLATRAWRWAQRHPTTAIAATVALVLVAAGALLVAGLERSARTQSEALTRSARYELYRSNITAAAAMLGELANPARARTLLGECPEEYRGFEWRHLVSLLDDGTVLARGQKGSPRISWADDGATLALVQRGSGGIQFVDPSTGRDQRTVSMAGHLDDVTDVSVDDAGRLYLGHLDGSLTSHDGDSGELLQVFRAPITEGKVATWVIAIPGRPFVVSSHGEGDLVVWNVESGEVHTTLGLEQVPTPPEPSLSADGSRLAAIDVLEQRVRSWDTGSWQQEDALVVPDARAIALDSNGQRMFLIEGGSLYVSRPDSTDLVRLPVTDATRIAVAGDGRRLVVAESERRLTVYDFDPEHETVTLVARLGGHTGRIQSVHIHPGGEVLLSRADDLTARLWQVDRRGGRSQVRPATPGAMALAFTPDDRLWIGSAGGALSLARPETGSVRTLPSPHSSNIASLDHAGERVLCSSFDNSISLWSWPDAERLSVLKRDGLSVTSAALHPDGETVVSGGVDGRVTVWAQGDGEVVAEWAAHADFVSSLEFSSDGKLLLTAAEDGSVTTWDWPARTLHRQYPGYRGWIRRARFTVAGDEIVAIGQDPRVCVWNVESAALVRECLGHASPIFDVAVSAVDGRIFTCDVAREVHVWDTLGERSLLVLRMADPATALAVSSAGDRLAVGQLSPVVTVLGTAPELDLITPGPSDHKSLPGDGLRPSRGYEMMQRAQDSDRSGK